MTDRELIELAAKAAGIDGIATQPFEGLYLSGNGAWNPLESDYDAFRLAVKLQLAISHAELSVVIRHKRYSWEWMGEMVNEDNGDRYAATRRAITRAAAEIGKEMGKEMGK